MEKSNESYFGTSVNRTTITNKYKFYIKIRNWHSCKFILFLFWFSNLMSIYCMRVRDFYFTYLHFCNILFFIYLFYFGYIISPLWVHCLHVNADSSVVGLFFFIISIGTTFWRKKKGMKQRFQTGLEEKLIWLFESIRIEHTFTTCSTSCCTCCFLYCISEHFVCLNVVILNHLFSLKM